MKPSLIILYFFFIINQLFAQGEIGNFSATYMDNVSIGLRLKSNGYGLSYRKGFFVNIYFRKFYEIEITRIRDPREVKFSNPYTYYFTTENIYFAKVNDCYDLRFGLGRLQILSNKMDVGSVELRFISSAGASLAFIKPVYYHVYDKTASYTYDTKFSEDLLLQQVLEMSPFYKGLDELKINPGIYVKLGISFEHSKKNKAISSLGVGGTLSAYILPIKIIYGDRGSNIKFNIFAEYRIGRYFPTNLKRKQRLEKIEQ